MKRKSKLKGLSGHPTLDFGGRVGGPSAPLGFEELQVAPRQRGFQAADVGVPFGLHRVHGTNELFEGVQSPAPLHQRQGVFPMLRGLEDEICERPPVEIMQVEMAVQGGATVERKVQKLMPKS